MLCIIRVLKIYLLSFITQYVAILVLYCTYMFINESPLIINSCTHVIYVYDSIGVRVHFVVCIHNNNNNGYSFL